MKAMLRLVPASLGIAIIAAVLAPGASAGCADVPRPKAAALEPNQHSYLMQAAYRPARFVFVDAPPGADVVGLLACGLHSRTRLSAVGCSMTPTQRGTATEPKS